MNDRLQAILTELRRELKALYGERLSRLILFGSQARGDAAPDSDIDIALILKGLTDPTDETSRIAEVTAPLSLAHDVVISSFCLSDSRYDSENTPFLRNIRREGVSF